MHLVEPKDEDLRYEYWDILSSLDYAVLSRIAPTGTYTTTIRNRNEEEIRYVIQEIIKRQSGSKTLYRKYENLKIRFVTDTTRLLREITPQLEGIPTTFKCVILGTGFRKSYVRSGMVYCPSCMGGEEQIKCDDFRRITIPRCGRRTCRGTVKIYDPSSIKTGFTQDVTIEEPAEEVQNNSPIVFKAKLIDSDVGTAFIGQRKLITGIYRTVVDDKKKNEYDIVIEVLKMEDLDDVKPILPTKEEITEWRSQDLLPDDVVQSFAPHIEGQRYIKKSIILCLLGGTKTENIREWINVLLVGDPGRAKTELLRFANSITQKSIYTTGKGTSAAGLTAGMVKQPDGTSILQSGVYPLCHNGHAVVDEFDKMSGEDRSVMHSAMEHGVVTKNVSGVNVKLPARVSTLAASNPKNGSYNPSDSLLENIDIQAPLLSRFDMVWLLRDIVDSIQDTKTAHRILKTFRGEDEEHDVPFTKRNLTKFINYAKALQPRLQKQQEEKLIEFYNKIRGGKKDGGIPITPRHLQSMVRLCMANAKLNLRDECLDDDVDEVIDLYKHMLGSFGWDLDKGFVQLELTSKQDKDKQFREVWILLADENGMCKQDSIYQMITDKYTWSDKEFNKYWWDLQSKGKILIKGDRWEWKE